MWHAFAHEKSREGRRLAGFEASRELFRLPPGAGKLKTMGNGRAHVLGAFKCMFLGDITEAPENPYAAQQQRLQ